jgi:protein arginine N-methyltransferase 3
LEVDDWSDDEDFFSTEELPAPPSDLPTALRRIELLERKIAQSHQDMAEYRALVGQQFDVGHLAEIVNEAGPSSAGPTQRDDDTHYFSSYCENGA